MTRTVQGIEAEDVTRRAPPIPTRAVSGSAKIRSGCIVACCLHGSGAVWVGMEGGVQRIGGSLDPSFGATVAFLHCALRDHFQKNPPVETCATTEFAEDVG